MHHYDLKAHHCTDNKMQAATQADSSDIACLTQTIVGEHVARRKDECDVRLRHHMPTCLVWMQNHKLQYKQSVLEKEIADMQEAFDSALGMLRREKLHLEADVKAAEIKRLTYQQELQLLKVLTVTPASV